MLVEKQYAKAGTHHPSFSISIRQCLITQKKNNKMNLSLSCEVTFLKQNVNNNKREVVMCDHLRLADSTALLFQGGEGGKKLV